MRGSALLCMRSILPPRVSLGRLLTTRWSGVLALHFWLYCEVGVIYNHHHYYLQLSQGLATWRTSSDQWPQCDLHLRLFPPLVFHQQWDRSGEDCKSLNVNIYKKSLLLWPTPTYSRWAMVPHTLVITPAMMSSKAGWQPPSCFDRTTVNMMQRIVHHHHPTKDS